jgi:ParB family chromosome partitioning protein
VNKADTLGPAPAFSAVRSARRDAVRKVGGEDATAALTELPVTVISDNPDNPRNHLRNLDETVESVREVGVILPIVVATADAYLRDRPDRADDLDDGAHYVVIDGHRRLEASRRVGLATIPVRVDNARVATDETLLEAAFVANYHRDDMTDLEEAYALQSLVDHYGSQTKAAKRLGIPQGTISTKLSLLKLTPELQKDLVTGARNVEHVRNLGKLSPQEQVEKADARAQAAQERSTARVAKPEPADPPAPRPEQESSPADYHGVIIPEAAQRAGTALVVAEHPSPARPDGPAGVEQPETVPEPRIYKADETVEPDKRTLPYDDGVFLGLHLAVKVEDEPYFLMLRVLLEKAKEKNPEKLAAMLAEGSEAS